MNKPAFVFLRYTALLLAVCVSGGLGYAQAIVHQITLPSSESWCDDSAINGLLADVNLFRAQNGIAPLAMDKLGMLDAEIRATQVINYFSTWVPGTPIDPHGGWDTTAASIGYEVLNEAVAWSTEDPAWIVGNIWQDPLHIAAMLESDANVAGVSCIFLGVAYWTYEPGYNPSVGLPPTVTSFTASPTTINAGQSTTLTWSVKGATALSIDNGIGSVPSPGSKIVSPSQTTTYTLTATNGGATTAAKVTVTVNAPANPPPTISSFTATPTSISAGQSSTLSWMVSGATTVSIDNSIGAVASSGAQTVSPTQSVTYTLTASNTARTVTAQASVTVGGISPPPPAVLDSEETNFLNDINTYRVSNGVPALQVSNSLQSAALWLSSDMASKNYFSSTDSLGRGSAARLAAFGYPYTPTNENIGSGFPGGQNTFYEWLTACDPDINGACLYVHRRIMLDPTWKVIGIGRAYNASSTYGWYWVTDFGPQLDSTPVATPVIGSFTASPSAITSGGLATLSWTVTGATSTTINNGVGDVSTVRSKAVSPTQTTTYTLTAANSAGSVTASVTVTVNSPTAPPVILSFTASPTSITSGASSTLSWSVSGATSISIDNNVGTVAASGSKSVAPTQTATYTLTATNAGGTVTARVTVNVTSPPSPPVISSFAASPASIANGASATLSWVVSGASSVAIDNNIGSVSTSGSQSVSPAQTTTYTLTAANSAGSVTSKTTVTVTGAPPPPAPTLDAEETNFLNDINSYRASNGAPALQVSNTLQSAALWMSNDMATSNYLNSTDSLSRNVATRLAAFGYPYSPTAENIGSGVNTGQNIFYQWLTACDPDINGACLYVHRRVMLDPTWKAIGIGRAYNANSQYGWYWATDFGPQVDTNSNPAPTIGFFTASPSSISSGQSVTLSWTVSGATSVTINNGVGSVTGLVSKSVSPTQSTTYTLTATNSAGSVTATATVTVSGTTAPVPVIGNWAVTQATITSGQSTTLSWSVTGATSVSIDNGIGSVGTFGNQTVSPTQTTTYTLTAGNSAGTVSAKLTVTVSAPALPVLNSNELSFVSILNSYRAQNGLGTLQIDLKLENAAKWMANDMDANNYVAHVDSLGRDTFTRLTAFGYPYTPWGEDLAGGFNDPQQMFNGFYGACDPNSSGTCTYAHRAILLSPNFTVIGIAYMDGFWAADFGANIDQIIGPGSQSPPTINSFTASPSSLNSGQSANLTWSVSGATTLTIDNGVGDVSTVTSALVRPSQTTTYTLTASNGGGTVTAQVTISVSVIIDTQPPTVPTLISATAKSSGEVDLQWSASTDNVGVAGYQILRNGTVTGSVSGGFLTYADFSVAPGATYSYTVKAFDAAGNYSSASNSVVVTTPAGVVTQSCPAPGNGVFTGCYFNNTTLSGSPALVRTDSQINFNWGSASPGSGISPGGFSASWQGYFNFNAGTYTFMITVSDGIRLYIDGQEIKSLWRDQPVTTYQIQQPLTQGNHLIGVQYYDETGSAAAILTWK